MRKSPFQKSVVRSKRRWLNTARAAELLAVDVRTIKRWMKVPTARLALGAVRQGKQWRIPMPVDEKSWEYEADDRLLTAGIVQKETWVRALERDCRPFNRCLIETYRLWLAAQIQASTKVEVITQLEIDAIGDLWLAAGNILKALPPKTKVDKLQSQFIEYFRAQNFSDEKILSIMDYWPEERVFKRVRAESNLEKLRRNMDSAQAKKTCKNLRYKPTHENIKKYLHRDFMSHINDTREELPMGYAVLKNPTAEELRSCAMASVNEQMQGKPAPKVFVDFRKAQKQLSLRTVKDRYPMRKTTQKDIDNALDDVNDSIPSCEERINKGQVQVRGSKDSFKEQARQAKQAWRARG